MSDLIPDEEREAIEEADRFAAEEIPAEARIGVLPFKVGFTEGARWQRAWRVSPVTREALEEKVRLALDDALLCGRVWEAWGYGTMTQDDFSPAAEDPEFVAQIVNALLAVSPSAEVKPFRLTVPDLEMESADYWRGVADAEAEITSEYGIPVSPEGEGKK